MRSEFPVLTDAADLEAFGTDFSRAWIVGVDLDAVSVDWPSVVAQGALFAGCTMTPETEVAVTRAGATVLHRPDGLPYDPFRVSLYTNVELMDGYQPGRPETTLDARICEVSMREGPVDLLARGMHDACIDAALMRMLEELGAPVVGVMGSHVTPRGSDDYRQAASLGRDLTRAGFVIATGGGPGLMEAANLGAWLADETDDALDEACEVLGRSPTYQHDVAGFLDRAIEVRARWPIGRTSIGVPTWIYLDEPANQFATHIAKYFQNSIRENGLLAIARGGIVYTPGASGTLQELFTDAAQNEYTLYEVRSPMVLLGEEYKSGALAQAATALQTLAASGGWGDLVRVVDSAEDATRMIQELLPPDVVVPRPPLRKH